MSRSNPLEGNTRYRQVKPLNSGTFGSVYLAVDTTNDRPVAIKFLDRGPGVTEYVARELETHRILWHPHVIKFRQCFLTKKHLGIVLEYADGGDMYEYVVSRRRLSENRARWIFQQLIIAVDYLHKMGVANRDIKLENTLLSGSADKPLVKLCDLGYAKHVDMHSAPNSKVGTPAYLAPEVISSKTYDGRVADIWSCAVMLYVMLVGQYPFERPDDRKLDANKKQQATIDRILNVDYKVPTDLDLSPECLDILQRMLVKDPQQRLNTDAIFQHPWYCKYLPPGVADMNKNLTPKESEQSVEEIRRIVREAQRSGTLTDAYADDMIDDMLDEM